MPPRLPRRECRVCGKEKPLSERHFEPNGCKGVRNAFRNECRSCRRKQWHRWNNGRPKGANAQRSRRWRQANPDRERFNNIRARADQRGKTFTITLEEYRERFWDVDCTYCGKASFGGIDRVDNDRDYVPDNCVPCCSWCNSIKMEHSVEEMLDHIGKILNLHPRAPG